VLFFINDIGASFKLIPDVFLPALRYVITAGFYSQHRAAFFLDSNAIECLYTFSNECLELFDADTVSSVVTVATASLPELKTINADKLIQTMLQLAACLPAEAYALNLLLILKYPCDQAAACDPSPSDSAQTRQLFGKTIMMWGAAFHSLNSVDPELITKVLAEPICTVLSLACKGLAAYIEDGGSVLAVSNFFRRLVKALKTQAVISR
jgi:hypothetical protein